MINQARLDQRVENLSKWQILFSQYAVGWLMKSLKS